VSSDPKDATNAAGRETRVPQIPTVRTDDPKLRQFLDAVRELLAVREGNAGNPLDANVTYRELIAAGLAVPAAGAGTDAGAGSGGGGGGIVPPGTVIGGGGLPITLPPVPHCTTVFSTPPPPADLVAMGGFAAILLRWNNPGFECVAYTEIFRHTEDNLTAAQAIGPIATTGSGFFSDQVGNFHTYFYWVRFVSYTNVTGPFNSVAGTMGSSSPDPSYMLEMLTKEISESQLTQDLGTRIDVHDMKNRTFFQPVAPTNPVTTETPPYPLQIGDVWVDATSGKNFPTYRWSPNWIQYSSGAKVFWQPAPPNTGALVYGDMWFDLDDGNRPYMWNGSAWVLYLDTYINAFVTNTTSAQIGYATLDAAHTVNGVTYPAGCVFDGNGVITSQANADAWNTTHPPGNGHVTWHAGLPLATATQKVGVAVGTQGVTMQQRFVTQAVDNTHFYGQYTLKIDSGGYVTGFGLSSELPVGAHQPTSSFEVRADSFAIAPAAAPMWNAVTFYMKGDRVTFANDGKVYECLYDNLNGWPPGTQYWLNLMLKLPFIVRTTTTVIDNITYPPGVWMNAAFIANATIGTAQIKELNADQINTITFLQSPKTAAGYLYAEQLYVGPASQFTYTVVNGKYTDVAWKEFSTTPNAQGLAARMNAGTFTVELQGTLRSPNYVSLVSGWQLLASGNAELNNIVARGVIYATAGQIGGNIIDANGLRSSNYSFNSAGWQIRNDGNAEFNNGNYRGTLNAIHGSFNDLTFAGYNPALFYNITWYPTNPAVVGNGFLMGYSSDLGKVHFFLGRSESGFEKYIWYDGNTLMLKGDLVTTGNIVSEGATATRSVYVLPNFSNCTDATFIDYEFTLAEDAAVTLAFTARHSNVSGGGNHQYKMWMDSSQFLLDPTLQANSDYIAIGFAWDGGPTAGKLGKGTHRLTCKFSSSSSNLTLTRALAVLSICYR
jgi:hypothetical protein